MLGNPGIWGKNRSELYAMYILHTIWIQDLNIKTKLKSTRKICGYLYLGDEEDIYKMLLEAKKA